MILTAYSPYYRKGWKGTQPGHLGNENKRYVRRIRFISIDVIKEICI
ncbi:hypothetical protein MY9_0922 [Bacillus sp. JS]|nr:hypothetical protein MY9_0922 [Bacillus sp. JS]